MTAHELVPECLVVEHLAPPLGRCVEDHPLAEDGGHEGIRLGLVEHLLGGPEEVLVGLCPGQQDDLAVGHLEQPDVTALGPHPSHEA